VKWRFKFGIKKTKCMSISGKKKFFSLDTVWYLNGKQIETDFKKPWNTLLMMIHLVLGLVPWIMARRNVHLSMILLCPTQTCYQMSRVTSGKPCQPILLYVYSKNRSIQTRKQCLGFSQHTPSSHQLPALRVAQFYDIVKRNIASLIKRIFNVLSPL